MKKYIIALIILCSTLIYTTSNKVDASDCGAVNFKQTFFEEYSENSLWQKTDGVRQIRWTVSSKYINNKNISKDMTDKEKEWTRDAIKSIDDALDSFAFVENNANPDIVIGYTDVKIYSGYWTAEILKYRQRGYIELNPSIGWWFNSRSKFIHTIQHELGNLLGAGDIKPSDNIISIFEDPAQKPYGVLPIPEFDRKLLKQLYGEDICKSIYRDYVQNYPIATP